MKVVIVGGGFGGVCLALNLANRNGFDVTLVSDKTYFEYHAALYRSATGRSPLEVVIPLVDFFKYAKNVEVVQDRINRIDTTSKTIRSQTDTTYKFDVLVLATGAVTHYFGIKGLAEYSYGVKTINEALKLKRHIHDNLINGEHERNYVVVGAGASGVELAAELTAYLKRVRRKHKIKQPYKVSLIEAQPRVLSLLHPKISTRVQNRLIKLGIQLYLSTPVKAESLTSIELPDGKITSRSVVWTAGVANNPLYKENEAVFRLQKNGKVIVNDYLEAAPNIYVIGDSASTQYSGMAQTALHDAKFLAKNLIKQSKHQARIKYMPKRPIYAIPVGPRWTAVQIGKLRLYGYFGWMLRRLADLRLYLMFLPPRKALTAWRYGYMIEESCPVCKK